MGRPGKCQGVDKQSLSVVGTFDDHQVLGVGTVEFPLITDAILDWKL